MTQLITPKKSARWYEKSGLPLLEVEAASGVMRPPTLADARKLDLAPSVTSILQIKAKHAIQAWRENNLLLQALTMTKPDGMDLNKWAKEIIETWDKENAKGSDLGSKVHRLIERRFRSEELGFDDLPNRDKYIDALIKLQFLITPKEVEKPFVSKMGYGGTIDLVASYDGKPALIDFKTQFVKDEVAIYREWLLQLTAYYYGAFEPSKDPYNLINIVISTSKPGEFYTIIWPTDEILPAWIAFQAAHHLWKWEHKF